MIYDDAQYTRRDWRNRNVIKTKQGLIWLTIPVEVKGKYNQKIRDVKVANKKWALKHLNFLKHNYGSAPYFKYYEELFEVSFLQCMKLEFLSDVNKLFITVINSILGVKTHITESPDYILEGGRCEKLISICSQANAKIYLSGPSAKNYIDEKAFSDAGIKIEWINYDSYPEYKQLYPPFEHNVSIIDLIFNHGEKATLFMNSF